MEPQVSGVKTWQWVVTIIVIIALVIIGILVYGGKKSNTSISTDTDITDQSATIASNRIVMVDQYPGNVVYLSSVQVEKASWVVIQSDNAGQPGAIMGSAHFAAGINPGKITLSTPTVDGGTYYAVIYTDDGSGTFNATKDVPLRDSRGSVIMHIFHASATAGAGLKG
ncbi:MAG: hypothetical protein WCK03_01910 [Candidatus Taylorbacteria bacterium]